MKNLYLIPAIILLCFLKVSAQSIIPAKFAEKHIGKRITVCDKVFGSIKGNKATLLYLGGDYPKQVLTVVIESTAINKFRINPAVDFKGKDICVTGVVSKDKGNPEIIVKDPKQIRALLIDNPVKQIPSVN